MEKLITKSFRRLLDKGVHRGFITYEELGKSLGKRHYTQNNIEDAFLHIFDNKVSLVEKRSDYRLSKKKDSTLSGDEKTKETEKYVDIAKTSQRSGLAKLTHKEPYVLGSGRAQKNPTQSLPI